KHAGKKDPRDVADRIFLANRMLFFAISDTIGISLANEVRETMNTLLQPYHRLRSSIKYKWILLLLVITLTPLIILGLASYSISKNAIDKKVAESSEQLTRQTAENIDIRLSSYKDMLMQIISNPDIIQLLKTADQAAADQTLVE